MDIRTGSRRRGRGLVATLTVAAMTATILVLTGAAGHAASGSTFTWHLDETSGSTMVDSTGGENGTIRNVTLGRPGVSGTAYGFNGSSSSVVVPNDDSLNAYDADVHISFWLRTTSLPSKPDYDLFRKGQYPGTEYKLELQPNGQVSCEYKGVLADGSMASVTLQQGPDVSDGQWHHVVCDKTATAVTLSVDNASWTRTKAVGSIYNDHDVVVGAYPNGDWYQGDLDEITLQIGARTPTPGPTASFTASPTSGTVPFAVQFTDTSSGSPTSWSWDLGDGSAKSTERNPSHTYTTPGTYKVTMTAANAQGSSTTTGTVKAAAPAPTAAFTMAPVSGAAPLTVQFTDASTGFPSSWSWDFGDGSTKSTQQDPSHTYAAPGTYKVTLTVANGTGTSTVTHTVSAVDGTPPTGEYTVTPTEA
ncbi:MAG TPA: PKD domain-containing protein, partial [Marmoricola sp.]|nr:PKD domain-containing protein [Marmoricola sp.]